FVRLTSVTTDLVAVQSGVDLLPLLDGNDGPEAQVEALYQIATGEGLGSFVEPSSGCRSGGAGYACFRRDALPIILMFTDAPFHNGPNDQYPYQGIAPAPHSWQQA